MVPELCSRRDKGSVVASIEHPRESGHEEVVHINAVPCYHLATWLPAADLEQIRAHKQGGEAMEVPRHKVFRAR